MEHKIGDKVTLTTGGLYGFQGNYPTIISVDPLIARSINGVEHEIMESDILPKDWHYGFNFKCSSGKHGNGNRNQLGKESENK